MRKMFVGIYNSALESIVQEIVLRLNPSGFTLVKGVYGKGTSSEPKMGTHVWPGENHILIVLEDETKVEYFIKEFSELKKSYPKEGVKAFVMDVSEIL